MAARVIHFGWDDCYRVPLLRYVGYEVREAASLERLSLDLERDGRVDAVFVSEDGLRMAEQAADVVRQYCAAPVILFRSTQGDLDESKFDLAYSSYAPPPVWLDATAALIARTRSLREESARLCRESKALQEKSRQECTESRAEHKRNRDVAGLWELENESLKTK